MSRRMPDEIALFAQLACVLEASAPKPGNVSPGRSFGDTSYEDFLVSAMVIGPALARAAEQSLGRTIHDAIAATARVTKRNTNLGIVLLLAPLARASLGGGSLRESLRESLRDVLASTTIDDARDTYAAIRRAAPGGLGQADAQDVGTDPTVTLREAMALAADRDSIAREWTTDFALTFDIGAPALQHARSEGLPWSDAVVECYLTILAARKDTLIARKLGLDAACDVSRQARSVLELGGVRTPAGRSALERFDRALRDERNTRNPGTTADLTAAAIFVTLVEHGWE